MKSVVIYAGGEVAVEEKPQPELQRDDDVLVAVSCSGLCGSDIPRIFNQGAHYYPITLGHEFCGRVVATGAAVTDLTAGTLVACVPLEPCFDCPACRRQLWSQCSHYQFTGSRQDGGNQQFIVLPRRQLLVLPPGVAPQEGAFIEPITVGLHALQRAGGCKGKHVIILGAGTIGLLAMQSAAGLGARTITAIDVNPQRLALARRLGATACWNSAELKSEQLAAALEGDRFDQLILETAGTPQTVALALQIAGPQAQVALVGTLHRDLALTADQFGLILRKELSLLGCWMNYSGDWPGVEWPQALRLFQEEKIDVNALIALQAQPEAYAGAVMALNGRPMNGKIMLNFSTDPGRVS